MALVLVLMGRDVVTIAMRVVAMPAGLCELPIRVGIHPGQASKEGDQNRCPLGDTPIKCLGGI